MMFVTKGRLIATLLIVGFLVAGLGMYAAFQVQDAEAQNVSLSCWYDVNMCCMYIHVAQAVCDTLGSSSSLCNYYQGLAGYWCSQAADSCGFSAVSYCYN